MKNIRSSLTITLLTSLLAIALSSFSVTTYAGGGGAAMDQSETDSAAVPHSDVAPKQTDKQSQPANNDNDKDKTGAVPGYQGFIFE